MSPPRFQGRGVPPSLAIRRLPAGPVTTARTYARALRFVAIIIALIAIGRQLAHEDLPPDVVGRLLALRVALVVISAVVALLCSPARSNAQLRALAFAYGLAAPHRLFQPFSHDNC